MSLCDRRQKKQVILNGMQDMSQFSMCRHVHGAMIFLLLMKLIKNRKGETLGKDVMEDLGARCMMLLKQQC